MIELSVGLPMFNCQYIGWLSLESLCRQQNIDFEWELIISEETEPKYRPFGKNNILNYASRLNDAGCKRVEYIPLKEWICLSQKWKLLGSKTSKSSNVFLTQGADDFSYPFRLKETYDILKRFDYVSSQIGVFYNIYTKFTVLYDRIENPQTTGLNNGFRIQYIKNLADEQKNRSIDTWLVNSMIQQNPDFKFKHNNNDTNLFGMFTTGLNNITKHRAHFMLHKKDIFHGKVDIRKYIPSDILTKLDSCKDFCKKGFY